jgi:hypothetical protein
MSSRLRTWAATGHYTEEGPPEPGAAARRRPRTSAWRENAVVAALVPVGVIVGTLVAVACMARLLTLPFSRPSGSRPSYLD